MPSLARRNLFHDKVRLTATLTGLVFAVVLITVQLGLFVGFASGAARGFVHPHGQIGDGAGPVKRKS